MHVHGSDSNHVSPSQPHEQAVSSVAGHGLAQQSGESNTSAQQGSQPASVGPHLLAVGRRAGDVLKQVGEVARLHLRHVLNVALWVAGDQDAIVFGAGMDGEFGLKLAWTERRRVCCGCISTMLARLPSEV